MKIDCTSYLYSLSLSNLILVCKYSNIHLIWVYKLLVRLSCVYYYIIILINNVERGLALRNTLNSRTSVRYILNVLPIYDLEFYYLFSINVLNISNTNRIILLLLSFASRRRAHILLLYYVNRAPTAYIIIYSRSYIPTYIVSVHGHLWSALISW